MSSDVSSEFSFEVPRFVTRTNTANNARLARDLKRPVRCLPVLYLRDSGLRLTVSSVALRTGDPSQFHFSAGYPPSQELGLLALRRRGLHLRSLLLGLLVRVRVKVRVRVRVRDRDRVRDRVRVRVRFRVRVRVRVAARAPP